MSLDIYPHHIDGDDAERWREIWHGLSGNAQDVLLQLVKHGPTYDGDLISKSGRTELLKLDLAAKIVLANGEDGYQAATLFGMHVWKAGQAAMVGRAIAAAKRVTAP